MTDTPNLTLEDLVSIQPGLARLMPDIGARMWKCFYAAQAGNWENAAWQLREVRKLFGLGMTTRPKYSDDISAFLDEELEPIVAAVEEQNWEHFEIKFNHAVDSGNSFHKSYKKPWIKWKLPNNPPPDLDFTPQKANGE
jgi:hypothetical protein